MEKYGIETYGTDFLFIRKTLLHQGLNVFQPALFLRFFVQGKNVRLIWHFRNSWYKRQAISIW